MPQRISIALPQPVTTSKPGRVSLDRWLAEAAWSRAALAAACTLGFPHTRMSIDVGTGAPAFWLPLDAAREWFNAFNRAVPRLLPAPLSIGADSNGISLTELRKAFGLSAPKFDALASSYGFPTFRVRERTDADGLRRTELFTWRHEVDQWLDCVRTIRAAAQERTAPPAA